MSGRSRASGRAVSRCGHNICAWSLGKKILTAKTFKYADGDREYQRYEGIMAWHPEKKSLYEISFAFDGSMGEVLIESKDADTLHIGWTQLRPDQPSRVRQVIKFLDADRYQWIVSVKEGDAWKQIMDATWKRKKPPAPQEEGRDVRPAPSFRGRGEYVRALSFPGSAWDRIDREALPRQSRARQSLEDTGFPGGEAWEPEWKTFFFALNSLMYFSGSR